MEELIYLLVKAFIGAMSGPKKAQQQTVDRAWQQRVWEQQRLMQQAALAASARKPVKPPALARVAPARPVQAPRSDWTEIERASRHRGGRGKALELSLLVQPRSLRRRFILTEILRPPVSMRPPRI